MAEISINELEKLIISKEGENAGEWVNTRVLVFDGCGRTGYNLSHNMDCVTQERGLEREAGG